MTRASRSTQRGFTLIETTVALIAFLIIGVLMVFTLKHVSAQVAQGKLNRNAYAASGALYDELQKSSASALALFSRSDALGGSCAPEMDFYTRDPAQGPHFWGYIFNSETNSVQRVTFASTDINTCGVGTPDGTAFSDVSAFTVSETMPSNLTDPFVQAAIAAAAQANPKLGVGAVNAVVETGFSEPSSGVPVQEGNRIWIVDMQAGKYERYAHLVPAASVAGFDVAVGQVAPSPSPTGGGPSPTPTPTSGPIVADINTIRHITDCEPDHQDTWSDYYPVSGALAAWNSGGGQALANYLGVSYIFFKTDIDQLGPALSGFPPTDTIEVDGGIIYHHNDNQHMCW